MIVRRRRLRIISTEERISVLLLKYCVPKSGISVSESTDIHISFHIRIYEPSTRGPTLRVAQFMNMLTYTYGNEVGHHFLKNISMASTPQILASLYSYAINGLK